MPMMNKAPGKELPRRSAREIEEMIGTIEQYLQQTREVLDRIEKDIAELKKEGRITGYLVGTIDRFNNAKKAEVKDRVKHGCR